MRTFKILLLTTLAFMLVGVLCVTMDAWAGEVHRPAEDAQATLCVNPGGTGGCYASIQAAVDAADDYNTVRVAQGAYYETVVLTKSLALEGGWNGDFSARDWDTYVTTIDAQRNGPVIDLGALSSIIAFIRCRLTIRVL